MYWLDPRESRLYSGVPVTAGLNVEPTVSFYTVTGGGKIFRPSLYANVGDIDGDGYDDLLLGDYKDGDEYWHGPDYPESGSVTLLSGPIATPPDMPDDVTAWLYSDVPGWSYIGLSAVGLGDQDGDGIDDFAVGSGAPPYLLPEGTHSVVQSVAWVVRGPAVGPAALEDASVAGIDMAWSGDGGGSTMSSVGATVTAAGDQNGDGVDDLAVASPMAFYGVNGIVTVFYGPVVGSMTWEDADAIVGHRGELADGYGIEFGASLVADQDFDGDGHPDLVATAYTTQYSGCDAETVGYPCWEALVVPGPLSGTVPMPDAVQARVGGDWVGGNGRPSMAGLGDIDHDGRDDVAVGSVGMINPDPWLRGGVAVFYGGSTGTHRDQPDAPDPDVAFIYASREDAEFEGQSFGFGHRVTGGHDLNLDGDGDLVIAEPWFDPGNAGERGDPEYYYQEGRVFVLFGGLE